MSKGTLGQVVKRAISDAGFRRQLQSDPEGALKGFDLTSDERAALRSGDPAKLTSLGVEQRMSKAYGLGAGASAVSKWGTGNDLAMGANIPDGGGEPLVSDALISGGGGRANDALIGEASGAKGARISDAGGAVRSTVTDGDRLGQVNAAFDGGDRAPGRSALGDQHDISRAVIGDSAAGGVRNALGDQHDGGRSAIGGESDRLAQVNAAFEGSDRSVGTRAFGDQDNLARSAMGDTTAASGRSALGDQHDVARSATALGPEQHAVVSSEGRDPYLSARDPGTGEFVRDIGTGEPLFTSAAAPLGAEQHAVVSSEGRDPYLSARDPGTGEFVRDIATGEPLNAAGAQSSLDVSGNTRDTSVISGDVAGRQGDAFITADESGRDVAARGTQDFGQQTSLDVSGNTRDASAISGDVAGRQGDAFITADEMGNDVTAAVRAPDPDTAITQREALDNTAMANPEAYERPDPTA